MSNEGGHNWSQLGLKLSEDFNATGARATRWLREDGGKIEV